MAARLHNQPMNHLFSYMQMDSPTNRILTLVLVVVIMMVVVLMVAVVRKLSKDCPKLRNHLNIDELYEKQSKHIRKSNFTA